ncbi:hypothetical protein CYMTET_22893 [Cymbomonas tetramitiformis]|uniref:ABC transporter domain-containing protein n=1 Tax=Cymbomonas tetramitiformis TaxID=36881 RepID=A0AAE0FZ11_9CHLO|nr:hypothetical protein CYMTET_22893 [Cymbomonas tetramitiformis]
MLRALFTAQRSAGVIRSLLAPHPPPKPQQAWFLPASFPVRRSSGVVASFKNVSFAYSGGKEILEDVNFSVRDGSKVTIMGQNGAGKSSIIKLLAGNLHPDGGVVNIKPGETVAVAKQTMPLECRDMTVEQYFASQFRDGDSPGVRLPSLIAGVLRDVDLVAPSHRVIKSFSGGQQARLLLAAALITDPTVLLLDEPTNNLDRDGIESLRWLIMSTEKTCLVISHDEDFLNSFTDSVLYLDIFSKAVEAYNGDYLFVKKEIEKRMQRENAANMRLKKAAQAKKDQAGVFAHKGGGMRKQAKKMREAADGMMDQLVDVRKEDEALRRFSLPFTPARAKGPLMTIDKVSIRSPHTGDMVAVKLPSGRAVPLHKGDRLHVVGPNGIGKTTFLELVAKGEAEGVAVAEGAKIGYYRQDFHNFDFSATVWACLQNAAKGVRVVNEQEIRKTAALFMLRGPMFFQQVGTLSEGQKALLSLCCLMLEQPSVLILDEPTNHVNFRHLPSVADAVKRFEGPVILVSHNEHWMAEIAIDHNDTLDMGQARAQFTKAAC